ncbi:hypothetical protein EZS27_032455 [termite gut metagenome]|uniref:Transposase IS701-like DDE domain-containing protein n=1 Tax=termite gut metagenome TaxID=433724 RepID=A0A5J4Q833_9ZZZZ
MLITKTALVCKLSKLPTVKTLENRNANLIDWYLFVLDSMKEKLQRLTNYVVADAYFSKSDFVAGIGQLGFHLVSRFRDDAVLFYPRIQETSSGKFSLNFRIFIGV